MGAVQVSVEGEKWKKHKLHYLYPSYLAFAFIVLVYIETRSFALQSTYVNSVITRKDIKVGDHIFVAGRQGYGLKLAYDSAAYYHHGVYLGRVTFKGKEIRDALTDFGNPESRLNPGITTLGAFLGGSSDGSENFLIARRDYIQGEIDVDKTIKSAIEICTQKKWGEYNLYANNCEHYASFLKIGIRYSEQAFTEDETSHRPLNESVRDNDPVRMEIQRMNGELWKFIKLGSVGGTVIVGSVALLLNLGVRSTKCRIRLHEVLFVGTLVGAAFGAALNSLLNRHMPVWTDGGRRYF